MSSLLFGAAVLVIGYMVISKIIGMAFRLVVPLVLIALLGGAGAISSVWPDSWSDGWYDNTRDDRYDRSQRPGPQEGGGIGDIRLGDIADGAVDAMRTVLQADLALLGGPEPRERDPAPTMRASPPAEPRYAPEYAPGERGRAQRPPPDRYEDDYEAPTRWR